MEPSHLLGRFDGAHWAMIDVIDGTIGGWFALPAPHGDPRLWAWARTRATTDYALQGFLVRPHKAPATLSVAEIPTIGEP